MDSKKKTPPGQRAGFQKETQTSKIGADDLTPQGTKPPLTMQLQSAEYLTGSITINRSLK